MFPARSICYALNHFLRGGDASEAAIDAPDNF
jgi:hypothetical protein